MAGSEQLGKLLILAGAFIAIFGLIVVFWGKLPILGKLPGDIMVQRGNFRLFFPIVSGLIISVIMTIIVNVVIRLFGK